MSSRLLKEREAIRDRVLREPLQPYASAVFGAIPGVASVTHLVAQYCNDNEQDEVRGAMLLSPSRWPDWPPTDWMRPVGDRRTRCHHDEILGTRLSSFSLPHERSIWRAFEPCCREGCTQHMRVAEAHLPYAIARSAGIGTPARRGAPRTG